MIFVVLPAYNAEMTLAKVFAGILKGKDIHIVLVDDGSCDNTVVLSRNLGIKTIVHSSNLGYGANQKTCYNYALKKGADYVVMLHPDGQYDPKDLPKFIAALQKGSDFVLGSRFLSGGYKETPIYKVVSLRIITLLFNLILGIKLTEINSGYRGYSRKLLETIPFSKNGDGYIFDPQMLIQAVYFGFKVAEVPVAKHYNKEAISPNLIASLVHGAENIVLLIAYVFDRLHILLFESE